MPDFHETLARVAREGPRIELGTVEICVLVAVRLLTEEEVLPELDEERLSDLYVRVVEVIEGGSRLPRKKATHGLELLRQQGLLSRVDGAGLVRCGAFSLTRLGSAIAESWIEDESLTGQSLVLLTTALRFKLGELLSEAQAAQSTENWQLVRQQLRVNVVTLVEGMRPNAGLQVRNSGMTQDARKLASLLGELVLVDRALRDGTRLVGKEPRAVLTIENLGAYQDAVVSDDVLVVHVPGWNTRTTRDLLKGLDEVPVIHFGDLDPNGIAILAHLRRWRPGVRWLVPFYWEERRDDKGLTREWPDLDMPVDAPEWVRELPERRIWLEQEVVAVDSRFGKVLEMEIKRALPMYRVP